MPMIKFVDDVLVSILLANVHSVFEIVQVGNRTAIHALLQQPGSYLGCWAPHRPDDLAAIPTVSTN